jgi:hypothetical protein
MPVAQHTAPQSRAGRGSDDGVLDAKTAGYQESQTRNALQHDDRGFRNRAHKIKVIRLNRKTFAGNNRSFKPVFRLNLDAGIRRKKVTL